MGKTPASAAEKVLTDSAIPLTVSGAFLTMLSSRAFPRTVSNRIVFGEKIQNGLPISSGLAISSVILSSASVL